METIFLETMLKEKKKSKLGKEQKEKFLTDLSALIFEEGFSDSSVRFILGGIPYGSASLIPDHFKRVGTAESLKSLSKLRSLGKGTGIALFRVLASLLSSFLHEANDYIPILKQILTHISLAARTKKGDLHCDACKYLAEELVFKENSTPFSVPLESIDLTPVALESFRDLMHNCLGGIRCGSRREYEQVNAMATWLGIALPAQPEPTSTSPDATPLKQTPPPVLPADPPAVVKVQRMTLSEVSSCLATLHGSLELAAEYVESLENDKKLLSEKLDVALRELAELKEQAPRLARKVETLENELKEAHKRNENLARQHDAAQQNISEQNTRLAEASEQLARQESVLSAFAADKKASLSAQMCALGAALRLEYQDFQAALTMPMSLELGENLRGQLQNIFRILRKNSIHFDGE